MAFGSFDSKGSGSTLSEINMVPLIDVMLVLLVIFIITAPLLSHSIRINVPQVTAEPVEQKPEVIDLAIDASGALFWNEQPIAEEDLAARFAGKAGADPQPEVRIRADADTRYGLLAQVMGAARQAGMKRLGFVTTPGQAATGSALPADAAAPAPATGQQEPAAAAPVPAHPPAEGG
ncbi:MAG: biopolymer transporter ExbD [Castellaniella sp.]|uniref:ExbD/TolR family protein n=1 Tax=Castellaniella sp. TaxID=1955812 RepID=UPI002A359FF6|nr:biopolymer transporter ExbD [Castellaniella sp.]MDY0310063.1 biopolymer transporter ExbD [Castellaniella sp.]